MSQKRTLPDPVKLVVFDFDGVFTDNKVYTAQDGTETVMCDRRDGLGVKMLRERGIDMFILSLETNLVVEARARKLGIDAHQGCEDSARNRVASSNRRPTSINPTGRPLDLPQGMLMAG